jgi:hypothetical protein
MMDKIEPALSAEEWTTPHATRESGYAAAEPEGLVLAKMPGAYLGHHVDAWDIPTLIALANHALPDSDPRKITRELLARIREIVSQSDIAYTSDDVDAFVDALESYLPPPEIADKRETLADAMAESQAVDDAAREAAMPANADYTGEPCPKCGRIRVFLRRDGSLECEKCEWRSGVPSTPKASA